jgi:hypothetical protein
VNKTYIPHYNLVIIYIYFVEYIFFYIFFTFGLATLTHTKHTYMWVKSKNRTSCVQQNASTEYKSATNKAKQLQGEIAM